MYQIKRNHVVEDLQVEDNGKTLDLHVDLSVDAILKQYIEATQRLKAAQDEMRKGSTEQRYQAMGNAVLGLFNVIFGTTQTEQILEFYADAYTEMLVDIVPFINDVVAPKIIEAQHRIMEQYTHVKQGRR
jgi:hypothetical protein